MAFVLMKIELKRGESERMKSEIENALASINVPSIDIEEIKSEMVEIIEDLMSQIRIPTWMDHAGGIASLFMQQKMNALQQILPEAEHPTETEEF